MDYILLVISGVVIGLIAAVPIGPVNLICIRRTLQYGPGHGFVSGMGAALGDGVFAIVTGFGLTEIGRLINGHYVSLQIAGGLLLLFFGLRIFLAKPTTRLADRLVASENKTANYARDIASTFALTITNPATLFGFTLMFAGLGGLAGEEEPSFFEAAFVVVGVFAGSTSWWLALTTVVGLFHARIDERVMSIINMVCGVLIVLFGLAVLGHVGASHHCRHSHDYLTKISCRL
jgi:threonine/homoserine/homoserine lactone efflux protein